MLNNLNKIGQKISKATKVISDVNSLSELIKGNSKPVERKLKNKVKNTLWKGLKL